MKAKEKNRSFLQYVDMISQGNWRGYIEGLPAAAIASELHTLCHAALFSKSSAEAVKFLEATQAKLVDAKAIPQELAACSKRQWKEPMLS